MPDRMTTIAILVPLLAVLPVLLSCESSSKVGGVPANPLQAIAGVWTVDQIGGRDVASMLPEGIPRPNFTIGSDGSVSGFAGVNRLNSTLDLDALADGTFSLSPIATTRMAGPPAAMDVESQFLQALQNTTGFGFDGDNLHLQRRQETLLLMQKGTDLFEFEEVL